MNMIKKYFLTIVLISTNACLGEVIKIVINPQYGYHFELNNTIMDVISAEVCGYSPDQIALINNGLMSIELHGVKPTFKEYEKMVIDGKVTEYPLCFHKKFINLDLEDTLELYKYDAEKKTHFKIDLGNEVEKNLLKFLMSNFVIAPLDGCSPGQRFLSWLYPDMNILGLFNMQLLQDEWHIQAGDPIVLYNQYYSNSTSVTTFAYVLYALALGDGMYLACLPHNLTNGANRNFLVVADLQLLMFYTNTTFFARIVL